MYALHVAVKPQMFPDESQRFSILFLSFVTFVLFSVMCWAASRIAEIASEIAAFVWIMPKTKGNSCFNQLRFMMFAEKETTLTLWGIMPIRKNFIIGMMGIIFTYTLMFYNLNIG
ncbi:hypothetical protein NPIL_22171 [Nephila pilipes]|uniref:Uncharacterized protein n=1 Tax=Nephila pilipes TaxID=299642 RepID=A0A8X6T3P1_NEPPI|nr:hypothetical protein NPIL_22171 [Nephila pilipes]